MINLMNKYCVSTWWEARFPKCLVHAPKFLFLLFLKYKTILKVRINVMYMYIHAYDDKLKCTYPKVLNTCIKWFDLFVFDLAMWQLEIDTWTVKLIHKSNFQLTCYRKKKDFNPIIRILILILHLYYSTKKPQKTGQWTA